MTRIATWTAKAAAPKGVSHVHSGMLIAFSMPMRCHSF